MCFNEVIVARVPGLSFDLLFCCCDDYHYYLPQAFSEQVTPPPECLKTPIQLIHTHTRARTPAPTHTTVTSVHQHI